jgi:hypothetical protein
MRRDSLCVGTAKHNFAWSYSQNACQVTDTQPVEQYGSERLLCHGLPQHGLLYWPAGTALHCMLAVSKPVRSNV